MNRPVTPPSLPATVTLCVQDTELVLTTWSSDDLDGFWSAFEEARHILARKFWWAETLTETDALNWLHKQPSQRSSGYEYGFKICDADGSVLGHVSVGWVDWVHQRATLGFWLRPSAQHQGHCAPILATVAKFAFGMLHIQRLELTTAAGSPAVSCFERAGAQFEGTARNRFLLDGATVDGSMFSITPQDL